MKTLNLILRLQIFIFTLIYCCNANADTLPTFGSPEDPFTTVTTTTTTTTTTTSSTTTTTLGCPSGQLTNSGECCQGAYSNNVGTRCCPTGIPLASGSTTECCPATEPYFANGTCHPPCNYYLGSLQYLGDAQLSSDTQAGWTAQLNPNRPACLDAIITEADTQARNQVATTHAGLGLFYDDVMVAILGANAMGKTYGSVLDFNKMLEGNNCTTCLAPPVNHSPWVPNSSCGGHVNWDCVAGNVYFDSNCNPVSSQIAQDACAGQTINKALDLQWYRSTPISLSWDNTDVEQHVAIVDFKLDLKKDVTWWTWKVSKSTPALVYDPQHQGKITSAMQLFGSWTFGGKKIARLFENNFEDSSNQLGSSWENGFEALSSLDSNYDNKLDGDELNSLALWFDNNQDAVSQVGEVISLKDIGVVRLFTKPDTIDPLTNNIIVNIGFERVVDGQIVQGKLIDWDTKGSNSQYELIASHTIKELTLGKKINQEEAVVNSTGNITTSNTKNEDNSTTNKAQVASNVTGVWKVEFAKGEGKSLLIFRESENGKFQGKSLSELSIESKDLRGALSVYALYGDKLADNKIQFVVVKGDGGTLESEASISADGKTLKGLTTAKIVNNKNEEKSIKYSWQASKMEFKK